MKRAMKRAAGLLSCGALALGLSGGDAEARQYVGVRANVVKAKVQLQVGTNAKTFGAMVRRGWRYHMQAWVHKGKRWSPLYRAQMRRASHKLVYTKASLCRGSHGKVVVQLAMGRQYRGKWWNSRTRRYQKGFAPVLHKMLMVTCNARTFVRKSKSLRGKPKTLKLRRAPARRGRSGGLAPRAAGRYGNAWRGAGRYGNAWRGVNQFRARYGNAWRTGPTKKGRYGNAWRK